MKVRELTVRHPAACKPEETLERAAQVMWERDCGCVPVVDGDDRPIGMITDRDVTMAAYTRGLPLRDVRIGDAMAREVRCCREQDPLDVPHRLMREHQVRRLPVVDDAGVLVGIVSLADLVRAAEIEGASVSRRKVADELLATVQAVSRPRSAEPELLVPAAGAADNGRRTGRPRKPTLTGGAKKP